MMEAKKTSFYIYIATVLISGFFAFRLGKENMTQTMLTAAVILAVGGYFIVVKKKEAYTHVIDMFVLMWAALYLLVPIGKLPSAEEMEGLFSLWKSSFKISNSLMPYYLSALIILIAVKKWKTSLIYRVELYIIVSLIAVQLFQIAFRIDFSFIYYVAAFTLLCEQISKIRSRYRSLFYRFLFLCAGLFTLLMLYPNDAGVQLANRIYNLFYLGKIWPGITIIILLSGIVCIIENYRDLKDLPEGKMSESIQTGAALVLMAVYITIGEIWPQFFNHIVIYTVAPALILIIEYTDRNKISDDIKFFIWRGLILCIPAAGRTLNERKWFCFVIIAVFLVRFILQKMKWKDGKEKIVMQGFWGIAAAVLLFCSRYKILNIDRIRTLTFPLITLLGSCVLWVILTHNTYAFDKQLREGKYAKTDYAIVPMMQRTGISLAVIITLFRLLF